MVHRHSARPTRREFLGHACRCGAGFAAITFLPACAGDDEPPGPQVELSQLPDGSRLILMEGLLPIEVSRHGDEVQARSLLCTHQGCQVIWTPDRDQYLCPCHEGVFDASGHPVLGPPREPLREFPVELQNGVAQIDVRAPMEVE